MTSSYTFISTGKCDKSIPSIESWSFSSGNTWKKNTLYIGQTYFFKAWMQVLWPVVSRRSNATWHRRHVIAIESAGRTWIMCYRRIWATRSFIISPRTRSPRVSEKFLAVKSCPTLVIAVSSRSPGSNSSSLREQNSPRPALLYLTGNLLFPFSSAPILVRLERSTHHLIAIRPGPLA